MKMEVNKDTRIDVLLQELGIEDKEIFINPVALLSWEDFSDPADRERFKTMLNDRTMRQMTIGEIADVDPNWNKPSIVEGMQNLAQRVSEKNIFYDIYAGTQLEGETTLMDFTVPGKKRFVVICAGGGYGGCCTMIEGISLTKRLNELGVSAFVLYYRVGEKAHFPNPMDDLARAVSYILEHASEFDVSSENYGIMGFSAGGHLAASFGTETLGYKKYGLPKPGMMFLGYPVISMEVNTHGATRRNLLGAENENDQELRKLYSVDQQVTENYPPTFIWQCDGDPAVPVENSRAMARELDRAGVPYRHEEFHARAHSWGLGTGTAADGWLDRAVKFWEE